MNERKAIYIKPASNEQYVMLKLLAVANGLTWLEMLLLGAEVLKDK